MIDCSPFAFVSAIAVSTSSEKTTGLLMSREFSAHIDQVSCGQ
jgi:hypothetical protein